MNATKTKAKTKKRPEIEPVLRVVTKEKRIVLNTGDESDYYLVNTDRFQQYVPKGGVIEVRPGAAGVRLGDLVLMTGAGGLAIIPSRKDRHSQIIGKITEVQYWPGQVVKNWKP